MDPKLLLVMTITLLYKESLLSNKSAGNSSDLAKQLINTIKLPEVVTIDRDTNREVILALRATVLWMADNSTDYQYDSEELLQRIRVNVGDDQHLFNAIKDIIQQPVIDPSANLKFVLSYRKTLKEHLDHLQIKIVLKDAYSKANFDSEGISDWTSFALEVADRLEPFTSKSDDDDHPSIVGGVSFNNKEDLSKMMLAGKQELSMDGVLKTGWQAINRMLGKAGGFRRGETCVISALQHNYKSGFLMSLLKHFALYNTPYMRDPSKKPMLLFISYENELKDNIMWLYKSLRESETGEYCDISMLDPDEAAAYTVEKLGVNGYQVEMLRIDPSDFTYRDLFDLVLKYESMGYEIHALLVDYLNMQSKKGCNQGPHGDDIRDLFRRVRNFTSKRGILLITPHQMSVDAKLLVRNGTERLVQAAANKGYYDGCKRIDQEVDLEILVNKEMVGLEAYLDVYRGKHRGVEVTPPVHLGTVLKFEAIGGILDDINGRDLSRKYIGGHSMADGGGKEWHTV